MARTADYQILETGSKLRDKAICTLFVQGYVVEIKLKNKK